jgi:hypothetical protein
VATFEYAKLFLAQDANNPGNTGWWFANPSRRDCVGSQDQLLQILNDLGKQGWEVTTSHAAPSDCAAGETFYQFLLKRNRAP